MTAASISRREQRWGATLLSALVAIFATACALPAAPTLAPTQPAPTAMAPRKPIAVIAHRGGAGLAPENTLASFRNGLALNSDFLEMDAHLTKDGVVVIIHDPTLDRTTDGKGRITDFTLAQLQSLNAAAAYANGTTERQAIPTLAQVLELVKPTNARIEVEIKLGAQNSRYAGIEQKMIDEISARGMLDRVQISSFDFDVLKEVKRVSPAGNRGISDPRTKTVALISGDYFRMNDLNQPAKIIDQMQAIGAEIIAINKDFLGAKLVEEAHSRKMQIEVWTVDKEDEMKKFIAMGVDGIISNRPDTLKRVLGR